jgi:hypothetical protein
LTILDETVEGVGIVSLEHLIAPLPNGHHMKIEILQEENAPVAAFLRGCQPGSPRPVYPIPEQTCHPDHKKMLANGCSFDYIPALDFVVLETLLSIDEANQEARAVLDDWNVSVGPGEVSTTLW